MEFNNHRVALYDKILSSEPSGKDSLFGTESDRVPHLVNTEKIFFLKNDNLIVQPSP